MHENQSKTNWIIWLILGVFFIKGVLLSALFPIFKGQDEARHYNSIQFLNEPKEKTWQRTYQMDEDQTKKDLSSYRFSEEIQNTAHLAETISTRSTNNYTKISFEKDFFGKNELEIIQGDLDPFNKIYPPDTVQGSLYHKLGLPIEKALSEENIFVRYFSIRIFSVFLGMLAIFVFYFVAKNIGFSPKQSLLLTAIISFQPKLSIYLTNINYDSLLILAFFLFTLSGVFVLKNGFNWKNSILIALSLAIGLLTKGTSIILFPVFLGLVIFQFRGIRNSKNFKIKAFSLILSAIIAFIILNTKYDLLGLVSIESPLSLSEKTASLGRYLSKIFLKVPSPDNNYWGDLDDVRNDYSEYFINIFWCVELISIIGIFLIIFFKKKLDFLPEKKYVIFLLGIWLALQFGVRFADWRISFLNPNIPLGTPGRYFLPALGSHLLLISIGLGMILRKKSYFETALKVGVVLMFAMFMHSVFNIIIPNFYL